MFTRWSGNSKSFSLFAFSAKCVSFLLCFPFYWCKPCKTCDIKCRELKLNRSNRSASLLQHVNVRPLRNPVFVLKLCPVCSIEHWVSGLWKTRRSKPPPPSTVLSHRTACSNVEYICHSLIIQTHRITRCVQCAIIINASSMLNNIWRKVLYFHTNQTIT